jgi:acyl-CoA hydrolase/GNAT superfamily N-acetyltransferase
MAEVDRTRWQERHREKVVSAEQAIGLVKPGQRILIGSGAAEPFRLVEALVAPGTGLTDNEIVHLLTLGPAPYTEEKLAGRFRHTAFFIGANTRAAVQEGRADFMPVFLYDIPRLIRSRRVRIDVALVSISPPDEHGYASLGVSVDIVRAAVDTAEIVLAEVNPRMPRTLGDSFVHVDRIDRLVPVDYPLPELARATPDEVSDQIGRNVAALVPDGATLQMGIGKIPDAVLRALKDHHDLGVHTEMLSDGAIELVENGVLTGSRKTLLPGKLVTSFLMGSERLYAWAHDNPAIEMRSSSFTNDPETIARNDRMVAINSALAVDLTGQVAADTVGGRFFSGIGGQVDFIRGAARAREGRPVIALPSTAKGGRVSRIQVAFEEGAGVVTTRGDVHTVVTEYGVADLWGKNIRQRAMALIEVAHPDFRTELLDAAKKRHYVFPSQRVPHAGYPLEQASREHLPGGAEVMVRPVRLTDEEPLRQMFYRLSDEDTFRRFMAYRSPEAHDEMQKLVDVDYDKSMALLVTATSGEAEETVAMARYDADALGSLCEIVVIVRDDWTNRGVATLLVRRMARIAFERGYLGFTGTFPAENRAMLEVFHKSGLRVRSSLVDDGYHVIAYFSPASGGSGDPEGSGGRHDLAQPQS